MDVVRGDTIAEAGLTDWRKLAQGCTRVTEWVTQQDIDLARRSTDVAAEHGLAADPAAVSDEVGDETARVPNLWFGDEPAKASGPRSRSTCLPRWRRAVSLLWWPPVGPSWTTLRHPAA